MNQSVLHILNGNRGLNTYPSVYNAIQVLAENGWDNHIFSAGAISGFESTIKRHYRFDGGYLRRAVQLAKLSDDFDLVILYEPRDVEIYKISRLILGRLSTKRLVHHSLEIPTELFGMSGLKAMIHRLLYRGYLDIDRLVIQDESRKVLLLKYFPILKNTPCNYISNSYLADIEPISDRVKWFDELRAANNWLVTYTGAIERWALPMDLFKTIRNNKEACFLFSGWSYDGFDQEAIDYCKGANHIHFDLRIKDRPEFNYIVKNSDIGLMFYDSNDPNVETIGMSSGKMHKFLSFGKPVVINDVPTIKGFLESNGFGIACPLKDMSSAISTVINNYETYADKVRNNYSSLVDFRSEYGNFISQL